jgi:hypothetical protein
LAEHHFDHRVLLPGTIHTVTQAIVVNSETHHRLVRLLFSASSEEEVVERAAAQMNDAVLVEFGRLRPKSSYRAASRLS